jgi:uncharacterized protein YceK
MKNFAISGIVILAASVLPGCTSYLMQQQGKAWLGSYKDCPSVYAMSRMELASLDWAFSAESRPADPCLAHYYPKADKDSFYSDVNRYLAPLYVLSLPADALLDTLALPISAAAAMADD